MIEKMTETMEETGEQLDGNAVESAKDSDETEYLASHEDLKGIVDEFLDATYDARMLSEKCRDYKDGRQWTEDQIKELKRRKQAPIVNNRIKVKHNGLLGLVTTRKVDPKAFARNEKQDASATQAATDGLRYVADDCVLQGTMTAVADNFFCEGYGGVHITVEQTKSGQPKICVDHIPWDRLFYDAYSTKSTFKDARSKGFMMWMDERDARDEFPEAPEAAFVERHDMGDGDTFEDKPLWFAKHNKRKRIMVATHYFQLKGVWHLAIYTGSGFLMPPMVSPYLDDEGEPDCAIEMESAYTVRDGTRKGELADFLDLQDEINHRRSKALFLMSQRQTFGNKGAVFDVRNAKRELAKPDGHLEVGQGEFGKDFGILPTGDMAKGQWEMLQEAKGEIDAQSYNAQLSGDRQSGDLSGKAIGKLQQAGVVELSILFDQLSAFRLRVYRQMWNRIRQFWDQEMWVRVTDDQEQPRYVGFNVPITTQQYLEEIMDDESKPYAMRLGASAQLTLLEQQNPQALQEVIMTKNQPAELDMDIMLDESYDTINTSQEQLDAIIQFGAQNQFDIIDLLEISNISGKKGLISKIEKRREEQAKGAQNDPNLKLIEAKVAEAMAAAKKTDADAVQTTVETELLSQHGVPPFKGTVSA